MWRSKAHILLSAALSCGFLSACSDDDAGTGPSGLEPGDYLEITDAALAYFSAAFGENQAKDALDVLGPYITGVTAQPAPPTAPSVIARIPSEALGGTFEWDVEQFQYVLNAGLTGAPEDGVRFLLYTVDEGMTGPVIPLEESGHFDIRDLSTGPSSIDVRHAALGDPFFGLDTLLQFDVGGALTETSADVTMSGRLSDPYGPITAVFAFGYEATASGSAAFTIDVTTAPYTLTVEYERMGQGGTGPGSDMITLQDAHSGGKIDFIVNWDAEYLVADGSVIQFDDEVVATLSGSGGFPQADPLSGSGLDENDALLLVNGYFAAFLLEGELIGLTTMGLANAGLTLPSS